MLMDTEQLTQLAVQALEDLKGQQIKVIDVTGLTTITDRMIVVSGRSDRQVKALANSVVEKAKAAGVRPRGVEGDREGEWVLIDLGDVVVHVMQAQARAFYQLEKLWDMSAPDADAHGGDAQS